MGLPKLGSCRLALSAAKPNNHPVHPLASAAASSALSKLLGFSRNKSGINPTYRSRALLQVGAERSEAQQPSGPPARQRCRVFCPIQAVGLLPEQVRDQPNLPKPGALAGWR